VLVKEQSVVTHRYRVLKETEKKAIPILNRPTPKHVKAIFCGHDILAEGVFVTQISSNSKISI
jgi:DNA-binding LacI/PurR family transcriptional regulator